MAAPFTLTGKHVAFAVAAFFGAIFLANAVMITLAVRTYSGVDAPKAYAQGLDYQSTLNAREAQAQSGWRASIAHEWREDGLRVEVTMAGATIAWAEARLRHPTNTAGDAQVALAPVGAGRYEAFFPGVSPAVWDVIVEVETSDGRLTEAQKRIWPTS